MLKKDCKAKYKVTRKIVKLQREKKLIPPNSSIVVAFSGGADSVALTLCLLELRNFLRINKVLLVHVNHMLRGQESYRDEEFCVNFAKDLGVPIHVERVDIKSLAKRENVELVARKQRYQILRRIKESEGFDLIATAHHLNDLVETVILWITRGCGLEGLLGFEEREGDVVRPLYYVKREEIVQFLKYCNYDWVEDFSNYDLRLARNRIRHKVIPELKMINPNLEETILRMREVLKSEKFILDDLVNQMLKDMDRKSFIKLPKEYQRFVLNKLHHIKDFKKIEQIRREIAKRKSFALENINSQDILE